ncbi:choice-of-anchor M domain-containing protein [Caulifigura coniformis]|nr:choice-of-anchor M domain-containing protein [Caulifigura coniformis]
MAALFQVAAVAQADVIAEYTAGHADIGLANDGGGFLHYHFGTGAVLDGVTLAGEEEFAPADAYVRVGDAGIVNLPNIPAYTSMLGVPAGTDVWIAPQTQNPLLPFLGFATEELDPSFGNVAFTLLSMTGPGQFALWATDAFGMPTVPGGTWGTVDGIDSSDSFSLPTGAHNHFNWGFTEAGLYQLAIRAESQFGGLVDEGIFTFAVGDLTEGPQAVPEPSTLLLCGLSAFGVGVQRLRRRKAKPIASPETAPATP